MSTQDLPTQVTKMFAPSTTTRSTMFVLGTATLSMSIGLIALSPPSSTAAAPPATTANTTATPRAIETIKTINTFTPGSAKLRKAQKRKLSKDVQTVIAGSADPAASTLRIVGHARTNCHRIILRGDIVCTTNRSLARQRTHAVQRYVRSIGYTGSITRVVINRGRVDTTDSTFTYTPPTPVYDFTVVNNTDGLPLAFPLGLSYPCLPAVSTCTESVGYLIPHQFSGQILQSEPTLTVDVTIPESAAGQNYSVTATNSTCTTTSFSRPAGPFEFTCTIASSGAVITVRPVE